MTEFHIGKTPSLLLANELSYWIQSSSLSFVLSFYCLEEGGKKMYPHCRSVENGDTREVFTWMSKVIPIGFGFALLCLLFCTETFAPFSRPIRSKANQSLLARVRFPALHADHVVTLWFDWFTRLPVSFVTGYFVLDFDIELKISLCCAFDKS